MFNTVQIDSAIGQLKGDFIHHTCVSGQNARALLSNSSPS